MKAKTDESLCAGGNQKLEPHSQRRRRKKPTQL